MTLRTRIIPILLMSNDSLVKTVRFKKPNYVGDPVNTVRIFNELEVDELIFLDISATLKRREPNFSVLKDVADECFMPLGYGGGITSLEQAKRVFDLGFEKISINSEIANDDAIITKIANHFGSQAVIASIDVKNVLLRKSVVKTYGGKKNTSFDPVDWAKHVEEQGAGEILLTSINREGTWSGFDLDLVSRVTAEVSVPVIAHGGAGSSQHIIDVVKKSNAAAVGLGSMVVFQKKGNGVLVNFPCKTLAAEL